MNDNKYHLLLMVIWHQTLSFFSSLEKKTCFYHRLMNCEEKMEKAMQ